jgi:Mg2+/citrate symporter
MYIIAIAWIYVALMMAITEASIVAGLMTFLFYGVLPVSIIVYVMGTGGRKRKRRAQEAQRQEEMKRNTEKETTPTEQTTEN